MSKDQTYERSGRIVIDFSRIPEQEFESGKPLRVASIREGQLIDEKVIIPAEQKNPRSFEVSLRLGSEQDGIAGAYIVIAPADDQRNLFSEHAARKYVSGRAERIDGGLLYIHPGIYKWWRFCWFPRTYHISGRVVRNDGDCIHPIGAANVEIYDVDYCWWWYDEDLVVNGTTDPDGYFDITFTWCVPLWCLIARLKPPIYIDSDLRDRLRGLVAQVFPKPPIPPGDPWEFERWLQSVGVDLPHPARSVVAAESINSPRYHGGMRGALKQSSAATQHMARDLAATAAPARITQIKPSLHWRDLLGSLIFWPPCDNPCDWYPDIRIRVTQNQPDAGTVEIFREAFWQTHWNLDSDLLDLELEANDQALYADTCAGEPILGNCMLFERVGWFNVSTIYQPDVVAGVSYGATPDRQERLGYTVSKDRAWWNKIGVHGRFGLAAQVDYYQVQVARWTNADRADWELDNTHVPADANFLPISQDKLGGFVRKYAELLDLGGGLTVYVWRSETFAAHTVGGISGLYKSRERFEQEYRDGHGGNNPAPDFPLGWHWDTTAETRLFDLDTEKLSDDLYSFRMVGYQQIGVDGGGQPILTPVDMGLPGGVCRRCSGEGMLINPDLLTLRFYNDPHQPNCEIKSFKKNGVTEISECEIVVLDTTDTIAMEFEASDVGGNLEYYTISLQHGSGVPVAVLGGAGVTTSGATPAGPDYLEALADPVSPATPPVWNGGTWTSTVPASFFAGLGGSCAYNLRLRAWDRQTNGWSAGIGWNEVGCEHNRAFTVILASDRESYCEQLGCCEE